MDIQQLYPIFLQYPTVQTDTRKLQKDEIFFALKGANFNGNEYAAKALINGAAYVVIDDDRYHLPHDKRYILVDDALKTLQQLALYHRKQFSIPFIAITGSNGKTTTKELIHAVLKTGFKTYATEGNLNNHIGVPLTLLKIKKDAGIAIIEMGANHLHEIESYCNIALPTHGIITNCGKAHLEGFGSEENIKKAKGELYDFLKRNKGIVFRNADLPYLENMAKGILNQITYGSSRADYTGTQKQNDIYLALAFNQKNIYTQLAGDYNFPNAMAALAIGLYFHIPFEKIKIAIENYKPDNSRSQFINIGSNKIILDAYNANPTSMELAIKNFAHTGFERKILWLGAMKEMGDKEKKEHQNLVDFIKKYSWEEVILVGKEFKEVENEFLRFDTSSEAAEYVKNNLPQETAILIKGSRASKMEVLLEVLR